VKAWWSLLRPRILAMVLLAMGMAAAGTPSDRAPARVAVSLLGAALVVAGAMVLNQRIERRSDAMMARTASRPLPAGRLAARQVTMVGQGLSAAGAAVICWLGDWLLLMLCALGWVVYVLVYTPLKFRSAWQTPVGAVAGALPVMLGAAAAGHAFAPCAWVLFALLFCWQFPHAMAIAWLNRGELAAAGIRVAGTNRSPGRLPGLMAAGGAAGVVAVWVAMAPLGLERSPSGSLAAVAAGVVGSLGLLAGAARFLRSPSEYSARGLLRASLVYLPVALLLWLVAVRTGGAAAG